MKFRACNQLAIHALLALVALAVFSTAGVAVAQTSPRALHAPLAQPAMPLSGLKTSLPPTPARQSRLRRAGDGDRVWAGTENGLAVYENRTWKTYTTKTDWRIAPCFRSRSTSAQATCGPAPWRAQPHLADALTLTRN